MHTKLDLVLGGISILLDKIQPQPGSPQHFIGQQSDHQLVVESPIAKCDPVLLLDALPVPSFPFPSSSGLDLKAHEVDPDFTPRIDMLKFTLCKAGAVSGDPCGDHICGNDDDHYDDSCVIGMSNASEYHDDDGFLDYEESCLSGADVTAVRQDNGGTFIADYETDSNETSDSSNDISNDPEFLAFMRGEWHPDM